MALFGSGTGGGLMARLFGGNQQPAGPAAEQPQGQQQQQIDPETNPMMAYLSQNQAPARQVAEQMMGERPEFDPRMGLMQLGLGILAQPGGQTLGQVIGQAGLNAMPAFMQERERIEQYDQQVSELASQLGMSEMEFISKMEQGGGIAEAGGNVYDKGAYQENLRKYGDRRKAFEESIVFEKSGQKVKDSRELARLKTLLRQQQAAGADSEEVRETMDTISALEAQIEGDTPSTQIFFQDDEGRFVSASGPAGEVEESINSYLDKKDYQELKEKQAGTDQVLDYASRIIDITDKASVAASGRLGGLASTGAAWSSAINEALTGDRSKQYRQEVGNDPMAKLEEFSKDRTARNLLGEDTIESMREIGNENAQALSNMWGLAYATARSQEPGGRLSNADIAASMAAMGFDPEAWLNDPDRIRSGVTELARRNVADYERSVLMKPGGESMLEKDMLLNKRLKEYGFEWTGGPRGELRYNPRLDEQTPEPEDPPSPRDEPQGGQQQQDQSDQQQGERPPINQMSREQLEQLNPDEMTDEELQEAAERYDRLTQGGQ